MPINRIPDIQVTDLGRMSYGAALDIQNQTVEQVVQNPNVSKILLVEHDPVLTFGKNSDPKNLLFPKEFYEEIGIEIFSTERGGEVTAHMPGQLVVYPILNIAALQLTVRQYVNLLEEAVIQTLKKFNIDSHRDVEHPGVWVGHEKICAIGVRIKSRVSMHGLALNITNDLSLFGKIVPCGIRHRSVTSVQQYLGKAVSFEAVRNELMAQIFARLSKYSACLRGNGNHQ